MTIIILKIDGFDYTPWVEDTGYSTDEEDLDSEKTGRVKSGKMRRDKITEKQNLTFKFRTMPERILRNLYTSLRKPSFMVTYHDIFGEMTREFYCSGRPGQLHMILDENEILWDGVTVNLHEM